MERQGTYLHTPKSSSSSGVDLTNKGLASPAPPSPSLETSDSRGSIARRRTSWGQRLVDKGRDPLQLDYSSAANSAALPSSGLNTSGSGPIRSGVDDLFPTPDDRNFPFSARYESPERSMHSYSTSQAGPSTASLIPPRDFEAEDGHREDDEAHLTANMSLNGTEERWEGEDPERSPATTPRSRRRTARYSLSPSPLKKTGTAIKSMTHNLRRASVRVVNLASAGLENQVRLGDDDEGAGGRRLSKDEELLPNLNNVLPIRGRALGCLGPESKIRLALFNFLLYPCVWISSHATLLLTST